MHVRFAIKLLLISDAFLVKLVIRGVDPVVMTVTSHPSLVTPTRVYSQSRPHLNTPIKPEPIPGLPDPSIAFPNSSAAFPKGCCTNVCLVSIPEAVNTIPKYI